METKTPAHHELPPDCFQLEEIETLQSFEGADLSGLNYYLWVNPEAGDETQQFLFFIELIFDQDALLLSSGEDSSAIRVSDATTLVKTAERLQQLHGISVIQRVNAAATPLWKPLIGKTLQAVNLSKHESGVYQNDALVLDFGDQQQVLIWLSGKDGLNIGFY